jgi:hypothetical protein
MAICDEACDQISYACAVVERFQTVSLRTLGVSNSGMSAVSLADDAEYSHLERAMQRLQSDYVAIERAFLMNALREATRDPPAPRAQALRTAPSNLEAILSEKWSAVAVDEDTTIRCFAAIDAIFFIASKALARAVNSLAPLAAAAVINFVAAELDTTLKETLSICMRLSLQLRAGAFALPGETPVGDDETMGGAVGGAQGRLTEQDLDDEIAERLSSALATAQQPQSAGLTADAAAGGDSAAHDAALVTAVAAPALSDVALAALNSLAAASDYASSLCARSENEAAGIFAPEPPAPLAAALDELHAVCEGVGPRLGLGAAEAASALCAPGLSALSAALRATHYVMDRRTFESIGSGATRDGVMVAFWNALVARGGLDGLLPCLSVSARGAVLAAVAQRVVGALETVWWHCRVDEYGALLMAAQLREISAALVTRSPPGSGGASSTRAAFSRAHQAVAVLNLEKLGDVYSLSFPVPKLSRADMAHLLENRVGLVKNTNGHGDARDGMGGGSLSAIAWDRVPVAGDHA